MTGEAAPPRPDPWATTAPREALRDNNAARIVSMTPGMTPAPGGAAYPANMVDFCGHDSNYVADVRFTGQKAMVLRSATEHVHAGGSGGICEPIGHAPQVRAGGSPVIRHGDAFWMDNRETVGEAMFARDVAAHPAPMDGDLIPGSVASGVGGNPNVQLAQFTSGGGTATPFAPSPPRAPPQAPPRTAPAPAPRTTAPSPAPRPPSNPSGPRLLRRFGVFGYVLSDLTRRQTLSAGERDAEDTAQRIWTSPEGQQTIVEQNLMWGRNHGSLLDPTQRESTPYGFWVGPEDRVPLANDILSARAGRRVDVRTAPAAEIDQLMGWNQAAAPAAATNGNTRISENEQRRRCRVERYAVMRNACGPGMQAHHIVPDYALRYGNRGEGEAGQKRIPGLPSFDDGMSICLSGNARMPSGYQLQPGDPDREHAWAHTIDREISNEGDRNRPLGTLRVSRIIQLSTAGVVAAKPECAAEIRRAVAQQYAGRKLDQLGRTTQTLPRGEAAQVLPHGATQGNWRQFIP